MHVDFGDVPAWVEESRKSLPDWLRLLTSKTKAKTSAKPPTKPERPQPPSSTSPAEKKGMTPAEVRAENTETFLRAGIDINVTRPLTGKESDKLNKALREIRAEKKAKPQPPPTLSAEKGKK